MFQVGLGFTGVSNRLDSTANAIDTSYIGYTMHILKKKRLKMLIDLHKLKFKNSNNTV